MKKHIQNLTLSGMFLAIGLLYSHSKWKCVISLYCSMLIAMLAGRAVWGVVQATILGLNGSGFTFQMFMAGAFMNAIPGIILQLILIPAIMVALDRAKMVPFTKKKSAQKAES